MKIFNKKFFFFNSNKQIVASLDEQNKKSQENEELDKQASLQSTSSISSLIANPQSQLEHNHTNIANNQCSSSISGSIIDLKAKQNSLKRIMANQQTQQQQLKPELEPQQQQQALNSYSTNDKSKLIRSILDLCL